MGFSPLGLVASIAVLAPNLLMLEFPPRGPNPVARVPRQVELLERAGQALCLVIPAITEPGHLGWWWIFPATIALITCYALWVRYLIGRRRHTRLYDPLWRIPVPMAVLPVVVFFGAAAWLGNPWIAAAALILAVGHIPSSVIISRAITRAS